MTSPSSTSSAPKRAIRVFVSSTFRDMGAERDELVKRVFPALRALCESRGVTWGEVDLRWGVTDEQRAEGQVLPICLAEIARCRPYFLGLLGDRYGWVPDTLDPKAVEAAPWIEEEPGASVTELEILHGVLRDPAMADHAFFYLRDPAYAESRPAEAYREVPTPDEVRDLGPAEAERRAADRRERLVALKARIGDSRFPVRDYPDPVALGARVLADLSGVIEARFPADSVPDPLDAEAALHDAFARSRATVYVGRDADAAALDAHAAGDGPPLVVTGESGVGKSALLATWALRYRAAHPEVPVILHFAGASAASADPRSMLRRLLGELRRRYGLSLEIPDDPEALRLAFANALHMAAARGRLVLVLDALDQLDDRDGAPDLAFLPPVIPPGVRLLLSTLPGRPAEAVASRGWPTHPVAPLTQAERGQLIDVYLAGYAKVLAPALRARVIAAPQSANPLYLRVLLEELRQWGAHETLPEALERYLAAADPAALFTRVLARWEADYDRDRPGLTADAMTALWAARRGLAEAELLDLLGPGDDPLPGAVWSPLFLAAASALVSRAGLLGFFHDHLRRAVAERYLIADAERAAAHRRLADYFAGRETGPRRIAELPWQLARAGEWDRLAALLGDLGFFTAAWAADPDDVKVAWAAVEAHSDHRLVEAYREVIEDPGWWKTETIDAVASLMGDMGHRHEALTLREHFVAANRTSGDSSSLATALLNRGIGLLQDGDWDDAEASLLEAEALFRDLDERDGLARVVSVLGHVELARGQPDRAMEFFKKGEQLFRHVGDQAAMAGSFGDQANVCFDRGEYDTALAMFDAALSVERAQGHRHGVAASLNGKGLVLDAQGDPDGALASLIEAEAISREIGDPEGVAAAVGNRGLILKNRRDLAG
ncbi:MAG: tetratricopeptide repeat protein, partial [Chloroflexota bacterium]